MFNFVIFGSRFFGKVDHVPGLFFVATKFVHIFFVPLVPVASYLVYEHEDSQYDLKPAILLPNFVSIGIHGTKLVRRVPFNINSVLIAWLRAFIFLALVFTCLIALGGVVGNPTVTTLSLIIAIAAFIVLVPVLHLTYFLTRARGAKAIKLGQLGGLPVDMVVSRSISSYPLFGFQMKAG